MKYAYWITTGLMSALMVVSAGMYFFNTAEVAKNFTALGYPTYLIYPLAIAKLLALVAIWTNYSSALREWAYAGLFYDFVLALVAHLAVGDGNFAGAAGAIVMLTISYFTKPK